MERVDLIPFLCFGNGRVIQDDAVLQLYDYTQFLAVYGIEKYGTEDKNKYYATH